MAAKVSTFYDDFKMPYVDLTKWSAPYLAAGSALTQPVNYGLKFSTGTANDYTVLASRYSYDLFGSSVYIQQSSSFPDTEAQSIFQVTRSPSGGLPQGAGPDYFRCEFVLYHTVSGFKLEARVYNWSNVNVGASFLRGTITAPYNSASMKFWRHRRSAATTLSPNGRHYWEYSANGVTWNVLAYADGMSGMPAVYVRLLMGFGTGVFQVRRININRDINRGVGFISDDFLNFPLITIPASDATTQFGQWRSSGTASVVQSPDDPTLGNNTIKLDTTGAISVSNRSTIRDLDVRAKIRHNSGTASRIKWRIGSDGLTYWFLHITPSTAQLGYREGGSETLIGSAWTYSSITGATKNWRVVHVGAEIVVLSDVDYTTTIPGLGYGASTYGGGSYGGGEATVITHPGGELAELGRASNTHLLAAGTVGFAASSSVTYLDDVKVINGVIPPAPIGGAPTESVQVKPWTGDRYMLASQLEYMRLEDDLGNTLNLGPSYGDIYVVSADLGSPEARTVSANRPLANGARSFTRFYGSKNVSLTLRCYRTTYHEANFYADLLQFWAAPGKKGRLVYKPRGATERYINIEGTAMSRPVIVNTGNQRLDMDVSFLAVDGGDYETITATSPVELAPATSSFIKNSGSLDTEPVIRIDGPCTNPVIYQETIEANYPGVFARLGLGSEDDPFVLEEGEFVELRYKDNKVQWMGWRDDTASRRGDLTTRDWFVLKAGRNSLRLETDEGTGKARVFWQNKY